MNQLSYTRQNSEQTLAQGLDEFYLANPHFNQRADASEIATFMKNHDTIHVVFGLTTAINDEMLADFSAMFCSDIGAMKYMSNFKLLINDNDLLEGIKNDPEIKRLGWLKTGWSLARTLPKVAALFFKGRRMKIKWQWSDHQDWQNKSLKEIRNRFDILV